MNSSRGAAWIILAAAAYASPAEAEQSNWLPPEPAGRLPAAVRESSGLAASRLRAGVFWTHEDSGGEPVLRAITTDGTLLGTVRIAGARNLDWEDAASFTLDGRACLLVADTGDNQARRSDCVLYVIPEPDPAGLDAGAEQRVEAAWRIPVVYPDGPRDCEAVAVDAREGRVYLLAKRTTPHGLYALPLRPAPADTTTPVAERVGEMTAFPAADGAERFLPKPSGAYRAQPTGMDFATDGSAAVVVTYGEVLVYPKMAGETWAAALARPGEVLAPHGLPQAEAVAFGPGGVEEGIHVTSEGAGEALLRYSRRR